jgi:hypothetical protein
MRHGDRFSYRQQKLLTREMAYEAARRVNFPMLDTGSEWIALAACMDHVAWK